MATECRLTARIPAMRASRTDLIHGLRDAQIPVGRHPDVNT